MGANMKNTAHGTVPDCGAIFMSNSMTRAECFERKLFGLPYWLGSFVLQIKSGMILFLFEYENRVLHGVFKAISDGAMNIVPHAFGSSGQQFPAQVKFSTLWSCNPLTEDHFQSVIKENYFSAKKFNFGLSEVQVHRLLSLFSLTKLSDQLHTRQLSSFEYSSDYLIGENQIVAEGNGLLLNGRSQRKLIEGEEQVNSMQESATLSHCPYMYTRNLTRNSGYLSSAQMTMHSLHSQSDYMTNMALQTSVNLENITAPSVTQSQINVSCSDPNLVPLRTQVFENDGSLRRSTSVSKDPSNGLNDFLFSFQNEQGLARQGSTELCVPETKEFPSQLPFDSVVVSSMPPNEHAAANHGHECYGSSGSMYSDKKRKGSVFSRLSYPSDASIQKLNGYNREMLFLNPSMVDIMSMLQQYCWQWRKTNHEGSYPKRNSGRILTKKKGKKSFSSSSSNSFQVSDEHVANNEDSLDDNSNHIPVELPFMNFKRRRKQCKVEDCAQMGEELSGLEQKRRKLIRPSFACSKHESGDSNSVSPSLQGIPKDSHFHRKSDDHIIEADKTEKLCPAVELPDIIWLVDDEDKNIGIETDATSEDCCGSSRNSDDRLASSNYISDSDLKITSKDLAANESRSSTHSRSTSNNHTKILNLNNSGLCQQELSLEGSEINAGNSFVWFKEGGNECNAKELIENVKIVKPFQDFVTMTESSSPLNSASENAPEVVIEKRKQNNENEESLSRPGTEL